jgi:hypothetical protein
MRGDLKRLSFSEKYLIRLREVRLGLGKRKRCDICSEVYVACSFGHLRKALRKFDHYAPNHPDR